MSVTLLTHLFLAPLGGDCCLFPFTGDKAWVRLPERCSSWRLPCAGQWIICSDRNFLSVPGQRTEQRAINKVTEQ
jgi:hypothetical protein